MTDRAALIAEKEAFAERLAEAIRTRSVEIAMSLLPSFEQNRLLMDLPPEPSKIEIYHAKKKSDSKTTIDQDAHRQWQKNQAKKLLSCCQKLWDKFPDRMAAFTVHASQGRHLKDAYTFSKTGATIQDIEALLVEATPEPLESGDISCIEVRIIRSLVYLNGTLLARTFDEVRCFAGVDTSTRIQRAREDLGFKHLSREAYFKQMKGQAWDYKDNTAKYAWMIHEGDLELQSEDVALFKGGAFLINGDLTVNGNSDMDDIMAVFVLGDFRAKNLFLGSSNFFVSGTTFVDQSVHVHGGSGAPVQIGAIRAPFVYSDSDAYYIPDTNTDHVKLVADYSYESSKGDVRMAIKPEYLEREDEDAWYVDSEIMVRAIKAGEEVFLPGFLDRT